MENIGKTRTVAGWFEIKEILPDLFVVTEPSDASFYILKSNREAIFVDSGFGLEEQLSEELLKTLGIDKFKVVVTHAHCDHVGMNSMAEDVYINKVEWEKYLAQNEIEQIKHYYELLKDEVRWPVLTNLPPIQKKWMPTKYIGEGSEIHLGKWQLLAFEIPGHTSGHMFFYEPNINVIFSGDLVYNGSLYANLKDSNINDYLSSLKKLGEFIKQKENPLCFYHLITLFPSL